MLARVDAALISETPEGIALELRVAGLHARAGAWLLDLLLRAAVLYIAALVAGMLGALGAWFWLVSLFVLEWLYPVVFELSLAGATPGKRILGLRVVMNDALPVTPAASFVRNLLRAADFLPAGYAAGVVCMLWRHDFGRLGDLVAGTLVVHVPPRAEAPRATPAVPVPPAIPLTPEVQLALVNLAHRAARLSPQRFEELAALAAPACGAGATRAAGGLAARVQGIAAWLMGQR